MAGVVEEVGLGVSQFAKGQNVVLIPSQSSYDSLDGYDYGENGLTDSNGTFSAPSSYLYPLPASISIRSATYLAALATAYHALLRMSLFRPLDNVLIVSSNPISLFLIRLLSLQNAYQIIVVEHHPIWKRLATQFGATHVINPRDIDISESVRLLTDDVGADVVFHIDDQYDYEVDQDIAAPPSAMLNRSRGMAYSATSAISACRTRGTIVNIAPRRMYEASKSKFRNELMMHEVQFVGFAGYDITSLRAALRLIERGDVQFEGLSLT
ncbi:quinone oxidoreductase, putative [Talaromyces stipitatus ATCC 10500]|uniref:Quinone oxidoreductase, putative n=1 Tax=Talaromyces stipitatus (strain ATCC 10500 / CBS 375.48 / QM 6759 / NRRL 1006) TaxID=441959 RepID=B8MQM7_TALSN|nr:quinone oxidoreductase, putative [Talaromyces stipitatus ATCC 10500]EED13450.1 quinone oxidoreductase, putative [Talaromyces stipitatus ATCC 10500]